jgi:DNA recombination protein RmuC
VIVAVPQHSDPNCVWHRRLAGSFFKKPSPGPIGPGLFLSTTPHLIYIDVMLDILFLILGLAVGGVIGWFWASSRTRAASAERIADLQSQVATSASSVEHLRDQMTHIDSQSAELRQTLDTERQLRITSETRLEEATRNVAEQKKLLAEAETKLKESFESLSAKALQSNSEQYLNMAKRMLDTILAKADSDLGKRQESINTLIKPLSDSLKRYEEQTRLMEQARVKAYGSLEEQVKMLTTTSQQLQTETGNLVRSLRDPKVRGRWGEMTLRRAAELAGMSNHCDFQEQVHFADGDQNAVRPDMIVHLPQDKSVVVDAKTVLDAYLDAVAATDEEEKRAQLKRHAAQVRSRIRELSSKSYWDKLPATPEFVVLFLPNESFFSAAVENDHSLIEDAIENGVVLASPTTLIALLRAIAYGWRQEQVAENAERISNLGRELYDRMSKLVEHLGKVGSGLNTAVRSYNQAVGSLESRVLPSARRFKELGAAGGEDIPELPALEQQPRELDTSRLTND